MNQFQRILQHRRKSRSQAFVEFAIILPMFLTFVCGILDYGFMIGNAMVLAVAAREGANSGARQLNSPLDQGLAAAYWAAYPRIDLSNSTMAGGVITKISPVTATTAQLYDTAIPSNSCKSSGYIFGGTDSLKNQSHAVIQGASNWLAPARKLPFSPSNLSANQSVVMMEVFCSNSFVTPIGTLVGMVTPEILYDSACF